MTFVLNINNQAFPFQLQVDKPGAKKLYGTLNVGGKVVPVQLTQTAETKLPFKDTPPGQLGFDKAKEFITKTPDNGQIFEALEALVRKAGDEKVKADELRGWIKTTLGSAAKYGSEWRQDIAFQTAEQLSGQKEFADPGTGSSGATPPRFGGQGRSAGEVAGVDGIGQGAGTKTVGRVAEGKHV